MADANDTACVRPECSPGAVFRHKPLLSRRPSTLDDVNRATLAVVRVLAQGVAAAEDTDRNHPRHAWWDDERVPDGLILALHVLGERVDALCSGREGTCA